MIPLEKTAQVWGIFGNLGGGKTMLAVSMAVEAIRSGYYVVSNVTLNLGELKRRFRGVISFTSILQFVPRNTILKVMFCV